MPKESHIYVLELHSEIRKTDLIFVMAHRVKIFSLYVFRSYGKTYTSIFYLRSCQLFKMGTFSHWRHEILARFHQSLVREARPLGSI